ncbi:MAG TPA: hypothetical protein VLM40_00910 [Gemmata sp.]|nr:hypothetical protein [Gemmata sp.]
MRHIWMTPVLALCAILAICPDTEAGWRRRRACVCVQSCYPCVPTGRYLVQYPCGGLTQVLDKRLQTDKRDIPEFIEGQPYGFPRVVPLADSLFSEPDSDTFTVRRHDRGRAKTTYASAAVEEFADLRSLILSLPPDEEMTPLVKKDWDFDRIEPERRNVRVTAYLFAVKKESDNDYHLLIDDDGDIEEGAKFNVEVAGIPDEGADRDAIRDVRDAFKAQFNGNPPMQYKPFFNPPKRVVIEGSLFFDRDHPAGAVGPQGYRPASAWEIHPVKSITFLK